MHIFTLAVGTYVNCTYLWHTYLDDDDDVGEPECVCVCVRCI